jgi:membrane fusion protein (multidrug efflux system)
VLARVRENAGRAGAVKKASTNEQMTTEQLTGTEARGARVETAPRRARSAIAPVSDVHRPALLLLGGGYYWLTSGTSVSTDDAQVKQDIVSVSPQVNGQIVQVFVRDGARVKRGELLFRIDPQPYRVALEQAEAQLATARLQTHVLQTTAAGTGGDITGRWPICRSNGTPRPPAGAAQARASQPARL